MKEAELWLILNKIHPFPEEKNLTYSSVLNRQPFNSNIIQIEPHFCQHTTLWGQEVLDRRAQTHIFIFVTGTMCQPSMWRPPWAWKLLLLHAKMTNSLHPCLLEPRGHPFPIPQVSLPCPSAHRLGLGLWLSWLRPHSPCPLATSPHHLILSLFNDSSSYWHLSIHTSCTFMTRRALMRKAK